MILEGEEGVESNILMVGRLYRHEQSIHRNKRVLVYTGTYLYSEVDVIIGEGENSFFC